MVWEHILLCKSLGCLGKRLVHGNILQDIGYCIPIVMPTHKPWIVREFFTAGLTYISHRDTILFLTGLAILAVAVPTLCTHHSRIVNLDCTALSFPNVLHDALHRTYMLAGVVPVHVLWTCTLPGIVHNCHIIVQVRLGLG